jgi:hypothetical protein
MFLFIGHKTAICTIGLTGSIYNISQNRKPRQNYKKAHVFSFSPLTYEGI